MSEVVRLTIPRRRRVRVLALITIPLALVPGIFAALMDENVVQCVLFSSFISAFMLCGCWIEFHNNNRVIELRPKDGMVIDIAPRPFASKAHEYVADQFTSVVTYQSWGERSTFFVELLTSKERQGLKIISFMPQAHSGPEYEFKYGTEPDYCRRQREEIMMALNLERSEFIPNGLPFWRQAKRKGLTRTSSGRPMAAA